VQKHIDTPSAETYLALVTKKPAAQTDGRHARSERTRELIVDVLLDLTDAGEFMPPMERVAEVAGVSRRVVFNHFRDREQLFMTAVARQMARVLPTLPPLLTTGTLEERLDAFIAFRRHVFEKTTYVRRVALHHEPLSEAIAARLRAVRVENLEQVSAVFAPELRARPPAQRKTLTSAIAAASGYMFWDALRLHQDVSANEATRTLKFTLSALLSYTPDEPAPPTPAA
jgi:TetR/AcrR family transcriptional regulator, regulator of autoinduction and epiphytic fitness